MLVREENTDALQQRIGMTLLCVVPYQGESMHMMVQDISEFKASGSAITGTGKYA